MCLPRHRDREENDDGGEGSRRSPPAKRPRCSCSFEQMELLEEMRRMLQGQNEKIEFMYRENQELREKVSFLTANLSRLGGYLQQSPAPRMLSDNNCSIPRRLQFVNSCSNDKYSTRNIEADDKNLLKVAIYDHNNNIITCEPFSSMRVHIVAIHGDFDDDHKGQWTEQYFRSKIVTGRPGKEHLLSGSLYFRLQDGVGYLNSAKFQDNSSFVPSKRFKLGVVAADVRISERIQEGITESFAVKDIRGFSTKKSGNPTPRDAVYKLSRIAMNGDRHKLLEQNGIKTVGDLLRFYSRSPEDLRKIMGKISDQDWDKIINHAHKCNPRPGIYSSCIQERNVSHDNEPFSRSNASLYLEGSCSVQRSPTIQKQLDVHVAHQQNLTTYNGISSGASTEKVSEELEGIQVADQQVSSVGNGIHTLEGSSSQQQRSLELNVTPEGNGVLPRNQSPFDIDALLDLENFSGDDSWGNFDFGETGLGGSCNSVEHSGGPSSINEARNMSYGGLSAASEAGSVSYDVLSPFSEVASRSYRKFRPTRIRKAGGVSYESTDFRAEDEC
ncbi:calmodulin-binding protein 60 C-like isoform X2 [Phragmites australis]|uniref:calmodulin-binding protein 60 C-like isoform X2 n=1 Tax=Phragmites australis TaxID=29695 RepID=UPI002D7991E0|nr:calmodulin-binding protein 60 C-like isoform X2 [Phragmites australis]